MTLYFVVNTLSPLEVNCPQPTNPVCVSSLPCAGILKAGEVLHYACVYRRQVLFSDLHLYVLVLSSGQPLRQILLLFSFCR